MKPLIFLVFILGLSFLFLGNPTFSDNHAIQVVTVHMTGNNADHLRACNCPHNPYGGFVRTANLIRQTRQIEDHYLCFHGGDFFAGDEHLSLHRTIMEILDYIDFDGILPGDHDYVEGIEFLQHYESRLSFLGSNVRYRNAYLGEPFQIYEMGSYTIGVFGVIDPDHFLFFEDEKIEGVVFEDPFEAATRVVQQLRDRVDALICISHLGYRKDRELANHVDGIDLILGAHSRMLLDHPVVVNGCKILHADNDGKHLIEARLIFRDGSLATITYTPIPLGPEVGIDEHVISLIQEYNRSHQSSTLWYE
jgi:2',3'-cyclic-nucleotide 2'-phosphodiesterase (5'-nucleotidase family)